MTSESSGRKLLPVMGGYPARRCPRRTHNAFDPTVPAPPPEPESATRRIEDGRVFEDQTVVPMLVAELGDRCVSIAYGDHRVDKPRRITETLAAMEAGVPVIIGAQLPDDATGGRTGAPDVLVRATPDGAEAKYLPADIKHHTSLKLAKRVVARVSRLGGGFTVVDAPGWTTMTSHRADDAMQLAHYTRMLQAMGRHPGDHLLQGAILGTSDFAQVSGERYGFVWYDLTAPTEKTPSKSSETRWAKRSVLDVYDHQFAFRQKVAAAARAGEELVVPFGKDECNECPYASWCSDYAGVDDVSFAITTGRLSDREWRYLYDQGLGTIDALANADPTDSGLLSGYLQVASHLPTPERRLSTAIRRARMHRDDIPLEPITDGFGVPVADVEIDFDVEWHPADGHVYQWGARVRFGSDEATATYEHSVLSFDTLDDASAQTLADNFFAWLESFVADHEAQGRTVGIYHWTTPETRLATKMLGGDRADELFDGRFVDLKALMATHYFARDGFSLKKIAPLFNFDWRAPDAGGDTSVIKIEEARNTTDPVTAHAARDWLLTYNEDDCAAQAAIRDGLKTSLNLELADLETPDASGYAPHAPGVLKADGDAETDTSEPAAERVAVTAISATPGEPVPLNRTPAPAETTSPISSTAPVTRSVGRDGRLLSLNEMRRRVAQFVIDYAGVTSERQNTSDFWKAFMRCYGVEDSYLHGVAFEYPARRSDTGREGRIDVFFPGRYLIEQKTAGRIRTPRFGSESNAEQQAKAYLFGGSITEAQMPRYLVTSDFATIQVTDLAQPPLSVHRTRNIRFEDLNDHVEMFLFLAVDDPDAMIAEEQAEASVKAARLMGDLYAAMTSDSDVDATEVHDAAEEDANTMEASILLTRLLFLMFGDDAGLWERDLFLKFVETRTAADGTDLGQQLRALFEVLDTPEPRSQRIDEAMRAFPYVNGDLYRDARHDQTMWFDTTMREALLAACRFDWSRISPAVFGSLFQTVKSKAARREDGEHYTSEQNILKTLRPLFLDEYRRRLDQANTKPQLEAFHAEFKQLRFVDPACGCGNFLIVAYREMRALELELLVKLKGLRGTAADMMLDPSELLNIRLDQFYGIELNWWPAKIAETAMYLVDHQANQKMLNTLGLPITRLPIEISATIHHGNALTTDWAQVLPTGSDAEKLRVFVFGNPPFAGHKERSPHQTSELQGVWGRDRYNGYLDYVTAWHAKTLDYFEDRDGEFAFVTTNSVVQGEAVTALFDATHDAGWGIKFAHRTFQWRSESTSKERAAVHCVIIGFTRAHGVKRTLFVYPTITSEPAFEVTTGPISRYLILHDDVAVRSRRTVLSPELPRMSLGSIPYDWGYLMVTPDQYDEVMADSVAAKYVRRYINGREIINNLQRHCLWLEDMNPADVAKSAILKSRIMKVAEKRRGSNDGPTRALADTPNVMRPNPSRPTVPYLAMPGVFAEGRPYATADHFEPDVIAGGKAYTCPDPDGFVFAVVSSSMFITWQKTVGGRIKSDPSFSTDIVWNNFPLPAVPAALRRQIIKAGEGVLAARALHPNRSLADHYQPLAMTPQLVAAHRALDKVVDKAFGVHGARRLTEIDRQRVLFDKYVALTA